MRWALLAVMAGCSSASNPQTLYNQGIVTIDSKRYKSGNMTYGQGSVTAGFFREQLDPYVGCSKKSFGACTVRFDCKPILTKPPPDMGLSPYGSAGTITVGGLYMPAELTVMDMGMFIGQYTTVQAFMPIFTGGESVNVSAVGDEVPAFIGAVTAPQQPTISAPVPVNGQLQVKRSDGLNFVWSGGGAGQLHLGLLVQPAMGMGTPAGLDCSWGAADGIGSIPSAALQMMPAGNGQGSLSVVSQSSVPAGSWTVQMVATTGPVDGKGQGYEFASLLLE